MLPSIVHSFRSRIIRRVRRLVVDEGGHVWTSVSTTRYMKCGRKWRVVPHGGGVVNEGIHSIMYADDTTRYSQFDNAEIANHDIEFKINNELSNINDWLNINKLALNKKIK